MGFGRSMLLLLGGLMVCSGVRQLMEVGSHDEVHADAQTGKCQRSCGDVPLGHFQAGDNAVDAYLNSLCSVSSCSGCTGRNSKGRKMPCCKGSCLTPTQAEIVAKGGLNDNMEIVPKGGPKTAENVPKVDTLANDVEDVDEDVVDASVDAINEPITQKKGKCQRSCGKIPLAHFNAGDDAVDAYLNSLCSSHSCAGCTGRSKKGGKMPCCTGSCLTPTQADTESNSNTEIVPKGGPKTVSEIVPKVENLVNDVVDELNDGSDELDSQDLVDIEEEDLDVEEDIQDVEDASVDAIKEPVTQKKGKCQRSCGKIPLAHFNAGDDAVDAYLNSLCSSHSCAGCTGRSKKGGKMPCCTGSCLTPTQAETESNSNTEIVPKGEPKSPELADIVEEDLDVDEEIQDILGDASACDGAGQVEAAFSKASEGSRMYAKTFSVGPDADAANALQAALEAFAESSKGQHCDVAKMTWGKSKYQDSVKGFKKAPKLVKEIAACCSE